jgi:transcriptional regulator with XRE-family HTH domain
MNVPSLIQEALDTLKITQAGLARQLGRGQPTVSRWLSGESNPDYESCLLLAQITGQPASEVLAAAGLNASLLPAAELAHLNPIQRDLLARAGRVQALADATDGVPDGFLEAYVRAVLDRAEEEITSTLELLRKVRQSPINPLPADTISGLDETGNNEERGPGGGLTVQELARLAILPTARRVPSASHNQLATAR